MSPSQVQALNIIQESVGGVIHTSDAIRKGINSKTLYDLRNKGHIVQLSRGVFRIADLETAQPDIVTVILRVPQAVICLISALSFHNLTTQIPHRVDIAIPRTSRYPRLDWPPIATYRFSPISLNSGIEIHQLDGIDVKFYSPEKTIVDCFKYRNKIGMDIVIEALKLYKQRKEFKVYELLKYSKICRVETIIMPYLEYLI